MRHNGLSTNEALHRAGLLQSSSDKLARQDEGKLAIWVFKGWKKRAWFGLRDAPRPGDARPLSVTADPRALPEMCGAGHRMTPV